jgi:Fe-S-cluster containining protein
VNAPGELGGSAAPADCRSCGACCFSPAETFVRVTGTDWTRLGDVAETVAQFIGHRAFMRMREGHCTALALRTDAAGGRDFFCTIYDRRPQICRDLARGSPECLGEMATKIGQANRSQPAGEPRMAANLRE